MRLLWDDEAIAHIARHGVEPWEVEEALADSDRRKFSAYYAPGDRRMGFIGKTEDGRVLVVVLRRPRASARSWRETRQKPRRNRTGGKNVHVHKVVGNFAIPLLSRS